MQFIGSMVCSGDLEKKLDSWLGIPNSLANQEKIQKATSALMRDVYHCIQTCGDKLSDGEVKTLKKAIYKFVQKRNVILARRIIQALDRERWDMLRIEVHQIANLRIYYLTIPIAGHIFTCWGRAHRENGNQDASSPPLPANPGEGGSP